MAVTTQSYTVNAGYTAAQFATEIRQAFIDSGLMTDWVDSFANGGVENRVLKITYDGAKTYGETNYWFQFSGADMFSHVCTGWNTSSDIPAGVGGAGTQYRDWLSTTTSSTAAHMRLSASTSAGFNSAQSISLQRIRSNDRTNFSVFLMVNGSTSVHFIIERTAPIASLVDLDKVFYTSMMWCNLQTSDRTGRANFQLFSPRLQRSHLGAALRGATANGNYGASNIATSPWESGAATQLQGIGYGAVGNNSSTGGTTNYNFPDPVFTLPIGFNNVNPAYTVDERSPYTGILLNPYSSATLPSDFAIIPIYNNNTITVGSTLQITAGVEEYLVIAVANASSGVTLGEAPSMVFGARTI